MNWLESAESDPHDNVLENFTADLIYSNHHTGPFGLSLLTADTVFEVYNCYTPVLKIFHGFREFADDLLYFRIRKAR